MKKAIKFFCARLIFIAALFLLFVLYLFVTPFEQFKSTRLWAQGVFELSCPAGTSSFQEFQTFNPTTGKSKQNLCIDATGNMIFQGTSGITQVTVNPVCPASGAFLYFNTVTNQLLQCNNGVLSTATGGWGTVIDAAQFGVKGDGKFSCSAAYSNGSNIVTTGPLDVPFTAADVGSFVYGTTLSCPNGSGGVTALVLSTITSVDSAHQIHVSNNATQNCTYTAGVSGCTLVWAKTDNTTALNNAWIAATTFPCNTLLLPAGGIYISGIITNQSAQCQSTQILSVGVAQAGGVVGLGANTTIILPGPTVDYTNATFAKGGAFFGVPTTNSISTSKYLYGFSIFGAELPLTNCAAVCEALVGQFTSSFADIALIEWGFSTAGSVGIDITGVVQAQTNITNFQSFGVNVPCKFSNSVNVSFGICYGGASILNGTGNPINTTSMQFTGISGATSAVTASGVWNSNGDIIAGLSIAAAVLANGVTANLVNDNISCVTGSCTAWNDNIGATTIKALNTVFSATTTAVNNTANGNFFDEGGNSFTGAIANAGNWFGSLSVTGTASATGNWATTSGWGTTSVNSAVGDSHRTKVSLTTTVSGAASPVLTWTFPKAFQVAPSSCTLQQVGGTFGTITNPAVGTPTATSVAFTFAGTPTATQTYIFDAECGP